MPHCTCSRCNAFAQCLHVVFVVQWGWDEDTMMPMCAECYELYRRLYVTRLETSEDPEEPSEDPEDPD